MKWAISAKSVEQLDEHLTSGSGLIVVLDGTAAEWLQCISFSTFCTGVVPQN
jgi:hypothetical protein